MQTTSQNDSMSMDFFQVGGYKKKWRRNRINKIKNDSQ